MKKITLVAMCAVFFVACKKNKDVVDQQPQPSAPPTVSVVSKTTTTTVGTKLELGSIKLKAGDLDQLAYAMLFQTTGSVQPSQIRNVYYVAKRTGKTDSIVSQKAPNATNQYFDWVDFEPTSEYTVTFYGDVSTVGTITPTIQVWYWWSKIQDKVYGESLGTITLPKVTVQQYSTMPSIEWIESTDVMQDSVEMVGYKGTITNPGPDRISFQQFAFTINVNDVGNNDNMSLYGLRWIVNGTDETDKVVFSNNSPGSAVTTLPEGNNKMYVTYVKQGRELVLDAGASVSFELRFTPKGLTHDGNGLSVQLLTDASQISMGYINLLNQNSSVLKITSAQASGSTGTVYNMVYSINGVSHSAIPGSSSKDFVNGYGISALQVQNFHQ